MHSKITKNTLFAIAEPDTARVLYKLGTEKTICKKDYRGFFARLRVSL